MKFLKEFVIEVGLVMFLLFTNLLMGFFTIDEIHQQSFSEKFNQIFTWQTVLIAFIGGFVSFLVVKKLR